MVYWAEGFNNYGNCLGFLIFIARTNLFIGFAVKFRGRTLTDLIGKVGGVERISH